MELKMTIGDITKQNVDVIVNAANPELWRGGGVSGAIHKAAGPGLEKECLEVKHKNWPRGLPVGEVAITGAYLLPAKKVFHTVGPMAGKDDIILLKKCYSNCVLEADKLGLSSIVFPAISTGIYGVPMETSAKLVREVIDEIKDKTKLQEIILIFSNERDLKVYQERFDKSE